MKNILNLLALCVFIIVLAASCGSGRRERAKNLAPNAHQVVAKEVIQTSNYTYVRVSEDDKDYWIAINYAEINEGTTYYWSQGGEMNNFTSKELKRTFPSIYFVSDFTDQPITRPALPPSPGAQGKLEVPEQPGIHVKKAEGGITIAELYARKSEYAGKTVRICGQVVKFSPHIMKKNWVHIQDGTKGAGKFDLTVTTNDSVGVGNVVLFEGVVALDKDFGYGYKYDVIIEDAIKK
jgi:hypothetical protein